MISDRVGESEVVVSHGGHVSVLDDREVQVSVERLLDVRHIFHLKITILGQNGEIKSNFKLFVS